MLFWLCNSIFVLSFDCYCHSVVFRSIPLEKKQELMRELEYDRMIRWLISY